jgi:hypothetical protein
LTIRHIDVIYPRVKFVLVSSPSKSSYMIRSVCTVLLVVLSALDANSLPATLMAHPFVAVYKISLPRATRYRTFAVRSDGAVMGAGSLPDANGHIVTARAIELRDRYIVAEPMSRRPQLLAVTRARRAAGWP